MGGGTPCAPARGRVSFCPDVTKQLVAMKKINLSEGIFFRGAKTIKLSYERREAPRIFSCEAENIAKLI